MAVTEGDYRIHFDVSKLNEAELALFHSLLEEHVKTHEKCPDIWRWDDWATKIKAPKYEAACYGANSDEVVRDMESFLIFVSGKLPTLKADGSGMVDYVMCGGKLEYEFTLADGNLDWDETDTSEDDEWDEDWNEDE